MIDLFCLNTTTYRTFLTNDMYSILWQSPFRTCEDRWFVHIDPYSEQVRACSFKVVILIQVAPKFLSSLIEEIDPHTISRPTVSDKLVSYVFFSPHKNIHSLFCSCNFMIVTCLIDKIFRDSFNMRIRYSNQSSRMISDLVCHLFEIIRVE